MYSSDLEMWNAINVVSVLIFLLIWNLITTWCVLCSLNNVQKNHLLVEMVFYIYSPAFFSYVTVITTCSLRWLLCMNFFTLLFLVKTIQKIFYKINFLWILHLRLVLLFLINLIENYKIKYFPGDWTQKLTTEMVFINWKIFRCHQGLNPNPHPPSPSAIPLVHRCTI